MFPVRRLVRVNMTRMRDTSDEEGHTRNDDGESYDSRQSGNRGK
jgi:hypothetical protein